MFQTLNQTQYILLVVGMVWLTSSGVDGQDPFAADGPNPFASSESEQSNQKTVQAATGSPVNATADGLNKILQTTVSFEYDEVPFLDVAEELRDEYRINVVLDGSAEDDSLNEDTIVSCNLKNVRLASAMKFLLRRNNATYHVEEGILRIISMDVAEDPEFFRTRIFDCRQLLQAITATDKRIGKPKVIQMLPARNGGFGGGGNGSKGGGGLFRIDPQLGGGSGRYSAPRPGIESTLLRTGEVEEVVGMQDAENQPVAESEQAKPAEARNVMIQTATAEGMLIPLVKTMVAAESWDDTNGDGSLMIISGQMVVSQSENVLDEVGLFLKQLENAIK